MFKGKFWRLTNKGGIVWQRRGEAISRGHGTNLFTSHNRLVHAVRRQRIHLFYTRLGWQLWFYSRSRQRTTEARGEGMTREWRETTISHFWPRPETELVALGFVERGGGRFDGVVSGLFYCF